MPTVAGCVDLVVQVAIERVGRRVVREVLAVPGRVRGDVGRTLRPEQPPRTLCEKAVDRATLTFIWRNPRSGSASPRVSRWWSRR